jgi:SPP1 family phage portal protein
MLDAINNVMSNRIDGIEQFIQSLLVLVNCELPEGATANMLRDRGLIELKSVGENKADIKILTEQLDQSQTQVLVDDLYDKVMQICAMPLISKHGTTYDTTGAAVLANAGWYQADAAARNTEDLFKKSNRQFDRIIVKILRDHNLLDISLSDFELHFVRNEQINVQSKAQAFQTLMAAGFHPILAASKSGISNDPVADVTMSEDYLKMIWGDPEKADQVEEQTNGQGEAVIIEDDHDTGASPTGGE